MSLRNPRLVTVGVLAAVFSTWELAARTGAISKLFFPAPTRIARALGDDLVSGDLLAEAARTLGRAGSGFLIGATIGLVLGFGMGRSVGVRAAIDPFVALLHPIPKIALFPLALLVFGLGQTPFVVVISLAAFFPMVIATMAGVRNLDPIYFDVAEVYGADRVTVARQILVPGTLPVALAGGRLALNSALVSTIAVEIVMPNSGLGALVWLGWETLATTKLYEGLIMISTIGLLMNGLIGWLQRRYVPWELA